MQKQETKPADVEKLGFFLPVAVIEGLYDLLLLAKLKYAAACTNSN